jgi:hypothetical protein
LWAARPCIIIVAGNVRYRQPGAAHDPNFRKRQPRPSVPSPKRRRQPPEGQERDPDSIDGGPEFAKLLLALKRQGVRITNEFSVRLEFPRAISREKALELVENMPKPRNGSLKVRIQIGKEPGLGIS